MINHYRYLINITKFNIKKISELLGS